MGRPKTRVGGLPRIFENRILTNAPAETGRDDAGQDGLRAGLGQDCSRFTRRVAKIEGALNAQCGSTLRHRKMSLQ